MQQIREKQASLQQKSQPFSSGIPKILCIKTSPKLIWISKQEDDTLRKSQMAIENPPFSSLISIRGIPIAKCLMTGGITVYEAGTYPEKNHPSVG